MTPTDSLALHPRKHRIIPIRPWCHGGLPSLEDEPAYRELPRTPTRRVKVPERREPTSRKWRQAMTQNEVEKLLRGIDRFSGEKNEDAEEFLETLDYKVLEGRLSDFEILGAVSTVLRSEARRRWGTSRDRILTWAKFKAQFHR